MNDEPISARLIEQHAVRDSYDVVEWVPVEFDTEVVTVLRHSQVTWHQAVDLARSLVAVTSNDVGIADAATGRTLAVFGKPSRLQRSREGTL